MGLGGTDLAPPPRPVAVADRTYSHRTVTVPVT